MGATDVLHLARRFFGSIRPGPPSTDDLEWVRSLLGDDEWLLFQRMTNPDRRHAVGVARDVHAELSDATPPVMAAALLHDVGKVESGFRTPARVVATIFWAVADDELAERWIDGSGVRQRIAQYRRHPEIGEQLLLEAGSDPFTSAWAADHHKPRSGWRADAEIGDVLKSCDDD